MDKTSLIFPLEIGNQPGRPLIKFTAYDRKDGGADLHHIYLPSPPGVSFTEQADFSSIDLGLISGLATQAAQGGIGSAVSSVRAGDILKTVTSTGPTAELLDFNTKTIKNPNTNTTYKSNAVRIFSFAFKLIARNPDESDVIRKIHSKFRHFTYANQRGDSSNFVLDFPPVWTIRFMDQGQGNLSENKYIPRIFSCYLTQCNSTFNADANIFHRDSAPLVIDMNITYQETRALTRNDIEDMENDQLQNRGIGDDGNPTILGAAPQEGQEQKPGQTEIPKKIKRRNN